MHMSKARRPVLHPPTSRCPCSVHRVRDRPTAMSTSHVTCPRARSAVAVTICPRPQPSIDPSANPALFARYVSTPAPPALRRIHPKVGAAQLGHTLAAWSGRGPGNHGSRCQTLLHTGTCTPSHSRWTQRQHKRMSRLCVGVLQAANAQWSMIPQPTCTRRGWQGRRAEASIAAHGTHWGWAKRHHGGRMWRCWCFNNGVHAC